MPTITAHTLVKNEENFVGYAIRSVIDFVDQVIVFDTGSTDRTVEIIKQLAGEYPEKIVFEEKGECDKQRHTELRQEMLDRTTTDWFMILDGDEVWTKRGTEEVKKIINENNTVECLVAPFYLCVGDIFHYSRRGLYDIYGKKGHFSPKIYKKIPGIHWFGDYGKGDSVFNINKTVFGNINNSIFLKNKFWHTSSLIRSSKDNEIILGRHKTVMTYCLKFIGMGFEINEIDLMPEVFLDTNDKNLKKMTMTRSCLNMIEWILNKLLLRLKNV
ncbi:MAG: glycosyltransferase [Patescibacteria group bacterium]|nr:glycosyltransferase [Patescibacteria group bacterium]